MRLPLQNRMSRLFAVGARFFFALTVALIPLRWRLDVWTRPMFPLYADYTGFHLFASDFSLLYMIVLWVCSFLLEPRTLKAGNALIWLCLVGMVIAGWVSVLGSEDSILSRYHAVRLTALLFFYLYLVNEIHSPLWVIAPVSLGIMLQSMIALVQFFAQSSIGLQAFGEHVLDPARSGVSIVPLDGIRLLRAYGLSDHPNILGGCIAFGLVLLLAATLYGKDRLPLLASSIFMISFPALLATFSRSAWIGLIVAGSFMVVGEALVRKWDSIKRGIVLGALSLCIAFPFLIQNDAAFQARVNSGDISQDDPMKERAFLMQAGNTLFVEHSAIGVGLGAAPIAMKKRFEDFPLNFQPPHYAVLNAAMETGVIGGIFYLLLSFIPVIAFLSRWRSNINNAWLMGSFALLLAISVVSLFDYYTWMYAPGRLWQWLGWGLFSAAWTKAG